MVGTVLSVLHVLFHSTLQMTLKGRYYSYLSFINDRVEA